MTSIETVSISSEASTEAFTEPVDLLTRLGVTPGKIALIAVLTVVLIYVVVSNLPSSSAPLSVRRPAGTALRSPRGAAQQSKAENSSPSIAWPVMNLPDVVAHDPFALPTWCQVPDEVSESAINASVPELTAEELARQAEQRTIDKLLESGTAIVMIVDGQHLAIIGDRQIRVGDRFDGLKVKAITESGVVLSGEGESE